MLGEQRWRVWSCDAHLLITEPERIGAAVDIAVDRLAEIGAACDRFRPDSELQRVPPDVPTPVSPMLDALLQSALETAERTDGLCDPTVGTSLRALGYDRDIRLVLDDDRPVRVVVQPRRSWRSVTVQGGRLTVPEEIELDLGATAKAFAADLIARDIAQELGCGALINLGGDIATAAEAPDGGWQVRVQDLPHDPTAQVTLHSGFALATSSTQRRAWRRGSERMHHIVDPRTGRAAAPIWRTVSVVARSAVEANGESTAAIVAGERALARLESSGLAARLVAQDGSVLVLNGWPDDAELAA